MRGMLVIIYLAVLTIMSSALPATAVDFPDSTLTFVSSGNSIPEERRISKHAKDVGPGQPPSGNDSRFLTFSLFLTPDPQWDQTAHGEVEKLRVAFRGFGTAIGHRHLAVWFIGQASEVDIPRSREYCDRFGLPHDKGPYVVTMQMNPDRAGPDDQRLVIHLGGMDAMGVRSVLNRLTEDLVENNKIPRSTPLVLAQVVQVLLSSVRRETAFNSIRISLTP